MAQIIKLNAARKAKAFKSTWYKKIFATGPEKAWERKGHTEPVTPSIGGRVKYARNMKGDWHAYELQPNGDYLLAKPLAAAA